MITTNTFTTTACGEVIKIQSGLLNCNSEKVLYFLRCKICDDTPYVGKAETNFFENENITYHKSAFIHNIFKIAIEVLIIGKYLYFRSVKSTNSLKKGNRFGNTN